MAIIRTEVFSKSLMRTVPVTCILPVDQVDFFNLDKEEELKPFKTLYLLHGAFGSDLDYLSGTRLQRYASEHQLAVIMPAGENSFYINSCGGVRNYSDFIGKELVSLTRKMFRLSDKREDTSIGGLSMGGYGAIVNGLLYHETFGNICLLSPALIQDRVIKSTYDEPMVMFNRRYYESIFPDINALKGSDLDYYARIKKLKENEASIPELFICCGEDDAACIDEARKYHQYLTDLKIKHHYHEGKGGHDWDYWDLNIKNAIEWLCK